QSTSPKRVLSNDSEFSLTRWRFEAVADALKLVGEVNADRDQLAGVLYTDPDGELAYCYNSETASITVNVHEAARQLGGWALRGTVHLRSAGPRLPRDARDQAPRRARAAGDGRRPSDRRIGSGADGPNRRLPADRSRRWRCGGDAPRRMARACRRRGGGGSAR